MKKKPIDDSTEDLEEIFIESGPFKPRYFWTAKDGTKLTFKEFMARWKQGMEGVTPLQQTKMQLTSTYIMLIGITLGLIVALVASKSLWWLCIILVGALFNTLVSALGIWQKKVVLQRMEDSFKDVKGGTNNGKSIKI